MKLKYVVKGKGENIILLHGWGSSKEIFEKVTNELSKTHKVFAIDMPGFGETKTPKSSYCLDDYVYELRNFITKNEIKDPVIFGHSFGGRIAIKYSVLYTVKKLVLIDSAGIKHKKSITYFIKVYSYKIMKRFLLFFRLKKALIKLQNKVGSTDYKNASQIMRETLVYVIKEDLTKYLPMIKVPVLLVWGEHDLDTPISDAYIMEKLIKDAGLVIIKNAGHFSFIDDYNFFIIVVKNFLGSDVGD